MAPQGLKILQMEKNISYQPLLDDKKDSMTKAYPMIDDAEIAKIKNNGIIGNICLFIMGVIAAFVLGFIVSDIVNNDCTDLGSLVHGNDMPPMEPPGKVHVMFEHNDTFAKDTVESHKLWRAIIPNGMGMIQHPVFGPEIVGVSFVHQLHCVNRLREGYYSALNGTENEQTTHHIRHCLEYLRQTIMCHVDTNLEFREEDPVTKDVSTSGYTDHQCRDFGEMFDFVEKWRVMNGKARGEEERIPVEEDAIPGRTIHWDYVSSRGDELPA